MNRKKHDSNLYILAGILLLMAGLFQGIPVFYMVACFMFILAIQNKNKKK